MEKPTLKDYQFKEIGEWRWTEKNISFSFVDYSPVYGIPVYMILSFFQDHKAAIAFFLSPGLSGIDRIEGVTHFNYEVAHDYSIPKKTEKEMISDIRWVLKIVDKNVASWKKGG